MLAGRVVRFPPTAPILGVNMNYRREQYLWQRNMEPRFNAAKEDFNEGIKYGLLFSIPACIIAIWVFFG